MDDVAVGRALRAIRVRKRLRQRDVAAMAGLSQATVSRIEAGRIGDRSVDAIRALARALEARVVLDVHWQAAELDRLLGARHSAMHEALARRLGALPEWVFAPEVSFAVYGERGVVDILAWHAASGSLLVIELKTELADLQETLGTLDRKVRLAPVIARSRGWVPKSVSAWLVIAEGSTNRARVAAHAAMLRAALPASGPAVSAWLRRPSGTVRAISFLSAPGSSRRFAQVHRIRFRNMHPTNAM